MYTILICDDNDGFAHSLKNALREAAAQLNLNVQIEVCTDGSAFRTLLAENGFNLLFLDYALPEETGYELARYVRLHEMQTEIVFVTAYPEKMQEAFPYKPMGFLTKPFTNEQLLDILKRFTFYMNQKESYCIRSKEKLTQIPVSKILYIESEAHSLLIHTLDEKEPYRQNKKLDELEQELAEFRFLRIHKSYLVNQHYVAGIDKSHMKLILSDRTELSISRKNYREVVNRLIRFELGGN